MRDWLLLRTWPRPSPGRCLHSRGPRAARRAECVALGEEWTEATGTAAGVALVGRWRLGWRWEAQSGETSCSVFGRAAAPNVVEA
jgi:hypothetical protein